MNSVSAPIGSEQARSELSAIVRFLRKRDCFVIAGHENPDGDCLGSQLALCHALRLIGKRAVASYDSSSTIPRSLDFLPGIGEMVAGEALPQDIGCFVCVDVSQPSRVGSAVADALKRSASTVILDHHEPGDDPCDIGYIDPTSASTSMIIWELCKMLGAANAGSALCCYAGLLTDTGGFRFANTDERALSFASEMVSCGADAAECAAKVYQRDTLESVLLERVCIDHMEFDMQQGFVMSWLSEDDFARCGATKADAQRMIDVIRAIDGVRVAVMLRDQNGAVHGSLRSKDGTDVAAIAGSFGGGGHKEAAGCTIRDCTLAEAAALMRAAVLSALRSE